MSDALEQAQAHVERRKRQLDDAIEHYGRTVRKVAQGDLVVKHHDAIQAAKMVESRRQDHARAVHVLMAIEDALSALEVGE